MEGQIRVVGGQEHIKELLLLLSSLSVELTEEKKRIVYTCGKGDFQERGYWVNEKNRTCYLRKSQYIRQRMYSTSLTKKILTWHLADMNFS